MFSAGSTSIFNKTWPVIYLASKSLKSSFCTALTNLYRTRLTLLSLHTSICLKWLGATIHIKYFSKISHLDTSLALLHHLTASKSFRKNAIQPRIHSFAPKIQFESSPSQCSFFRNVYIIHSLCYGADKWLQSCSCSAEIVWKNLWCPPEYSQVHKTHPVLENPAQTRTGLLWPPGNVPVGFGLSPVGAFALPEGFGAHPEPGFSLSLFPHMRGSVCRSVCTQTLHVCIKSVHAGQAYTQCLYSQ